MLDALRRSLSRAALPLSLTLVAAFGLSTSGCLALISGIQDTTLEFPLEAKPNATFWAWNEIEVDQDISSINSATLVSVTLKVTAPAGQNFSFLKSLKGEAVTPSGRTLVAKIDNVPPQEQALILDVEYTGDLHPLFRDQHTIRFEWTGATNPAFTEWPPGGFNIEAHIQINIE